MGQLRSSDSPMVCLFLTLILLVIDLADKLLARSRGRGNVRVGEIALGTNAASVLVKTSRPGFVAAHGGLLATVCNKVLHLLLLLLNKSVLLSFVLQTLGQADELEKHFGVFGDVQRRERVLVQHQVQMPASVNTADPVLLEEAEGLPGVADILRVALPNLLHLLDPALQNGNDSDAVKFLLVEKRGIAPKLLPA